MTSIERAMDPNRRVANQVAETAERPPAEKPGQGAGGEGQTRPRLVELDFTELTRRGLLIPSGNDPKLEEEFRLAKRPLLKHAFPRDMRPMPRANLALVTSNTDGEGKSFTTFNLAMSIAMEMDHTVLVVDGDVSRNSLTRWLGMAGERGLTDVLDDPDLGLGDVIAQTNLDNLRVIPSGRSHSRATELMASHAMEEVAEELAGRYPDRMVLFDSPPLLMTSQAAVLANLVGQAVIVVEAGKTTQQAVQDGLNLVDPAVTKVGFMLNKAPRGKHSGYFGAY